LELIYRVRSSAQQVAANVVRLNFDIGVIIN
jgi:hypothetical protein